MYNSQREQLAKLMGGGEVKEEQRTKRFFVVSVRPCQNVSKIKLLLMLIKISGKASTFVEHRLTLNSFYPVRFN